jgi:hypothetical protein
MLVFVRANVSAFPFQEKLVDKGKRLVENLFQAGEKSVNLINEIGIWETELANEPATQASDSLTHAFL